MLLEVDAINTFRGPAHILRGVSLTVGDNEVVSLVGRNGAGRTTIIESITGLLPVRSGKIGSAAATSPACRRTGAPGAASATRRRTPASSPSSRWPRT